MKNKRAFLLVLLFLVLVPTVLAQQKIEISSIKIDSKAFPGSEVLFQLNVKNFQIREDIIKVTPDPFSMYPFSDFATSISVNPSQLTIPALGEGNFEVKIRYAQNVKAEKAYTANVIVQSLLNSDIKSVYPLTSFILGSGDIISIKPQIIEKIIPGRDTPLEVTFKNNINQDFVNLDFLLTSPSFNEEHKISLSRNQEITNTFNLKLPPETPASDYSLFLRLYKEGVLKGEKEIIFKVEETSDFQEKINRETGFLSSRTTLTKTNNGNVKIDRTVKYPVGLLQEIFTETSLKANYVKEENQRYLQWNLEINPGEKKEIIIETNYNSLFFTILALIILLAVIYYSKIRALKITKRVVRVKEKDKHHLKVVLNIQNYTNKDLHDVKVMDFLPKLIKHYSDFGTLEPTHIQQGSHGLRFIWEIHKLHRGEERIISYKIEPQLNLFGNIKLPSASLQYTKDNKLVVRKSNKAKFQLKREL